VQLQKHSLAHRVFVSLVREYRTAKGMTQGQLADALGVVQPFISKVETGERRLDVVEWVSVCAVLEVPPEEFLAALQQRLAVRGSHEARSKILKEG